MTPDDLRRWEAVARDIAAREARDRGLDFELEVVEGPGGTAVRCGRVRFPVADLDPEQLFTEIDRWVAFERGGGAADLIDRDRAYVAEREALLPLAVAAWQRCLEPVVADVRRTTDLGGAWRIAVRRDEDARLRARRLDPRPGSGLTITPGRPSGRRAPLVLAVLDLVMPEGSSRSLPVSVVADDGVATIATMVQEHVIDEIRGAWPACFGHGHPAEVDGLHWACPATHAVVASIGRLGL